MPRKILMFLIVILAFALVVACSDGTSTETSTETSTDNSDSSSSEAPSESTVKESSNKPTIQFFVNEHPSWPTNREHLVWKLMEEGGNMNLDLNIAAEPYLESLNLVIASGNLPDMLHMPNYLVGNRYGAQGALVNILDYIDMMPNLKKFINNYPEHAQRALSYDGKMYVAPNYGIGDTNRMLWLYRQDIFKKHGLETPDTYDELYQTLKELKSIYPESYPFGFRGGLGKLRNLAPNFETYSEYYYDWDTKEWKYGPVDDKYKKMIEYLHRFYNEKLIPPDFLSLDTTQWQQLISTGKSFITQDYIGRIDMFNIPLRVEIPDFTLINMPPPAGIPGGKQQDFSAHYLNAGYAIASTSKNIEAVIKYIDWTFSEDGRDKLSWGREGETYVIENGEKQFVPELTKGSVDNLRAETGLSLFGTYSLFDYDAHMRLFSEEVVNAYKEDRKYDAPFVPEPPFTEAEQETLAIKGEAIIKHRDENISKFILGERSLTEWDQYVQEMEKLGLKEMIDIYAGAYQRILDVEL